MSMDLTGITNRNEYYTNHYFSSIFEENAADTLSNWRAEAKENDTVRTPWSQLRDAARLYYPLHDRFLRAKFDTQTLANIRTMADTYLSALGFPFAAPEWVDIDDTTKVPVYLEVNKANGAPAVWIILAASDEKDASLLDQYCFAADDFGEEGLGSVPSECLTMIPNEEMITKVLFGQQEPPRFVILIGMNQIALIDRNKWNEKRYLQFELEEIFSRHEETTLQAMAVLLHKDSLCPAEGTALLDELDANSQKHAAGVSQDLKYALRESIELLGNEVLYDMAHRQGRDLDADPVDAGQLTIECLRYMYRMLFMLFIESRPELGYAPIKAQVYLTGYSLESLRDIADAVRDDITEVGSGYYLHETISKLFDLIYNGYPETEEEILQYSGEESIHDMFVISPLKAHIFDPEFTKMFSQVKLRNSVMLRIIDLMSLTRETGKRNSRRGRISYSNLGINQMGSVYEALLSYRGFIAEHTLFEVKKADENFDELDVGYFVREEELDQYTQDERVRYEKDDPDGRYRKGQLRKYEKGTFIYRLAGREREKSASYYTPEVLTKCLVKYALKELLEGKTADDILQLTICEPAMGSAAFLNEAINQLAEAYLDRRQKEHGEMIPADKRQRELQKVKMYIADRNVYGIDLNPVAVELAEVSLWLNTIYEGGYVPWFGTQLVNGNSLIGARRQCYRVENLQTKTKGLRWFENEPERVPLGTIRADKNYQKKRKQIYHFLLGDPGMCSYSDSVIKSLEPENIKRMKDWNKKFNQPFSDDDVDTLLRLSSAIDDLWDAQIRLRQEVEEKTNDRLSVYGWDDDSEDSHTTIRQKDQILSELYRSEHMRNAGPYARLKLAMDYWCALWFWPIDKADLLPTRSEFFFDMSLILEGTLGAVKIDQRIKDGQLTLFSTELEDMAQDILETYGVDTVVDIPRLRKENERIDLAFGIAEQNHFMHWELEFAEVFAKHGGFDLILGNPPWIKLKWSFPNVMSDSNPVYVVKNFSSADTVKHLPDSLKDHNIRKVVFGEYVAIAGALQFYNSIQNYPLLQGQQTNLYKCFLPQAWMITNKKGISSFVHPEDIYGDANGGMIRKEMYSRLRRHFQIQNELIYFPIGDREKYSLNIYSNQYTDTFESISNIFNISTVDLCYEHDGSGEVPGIKDDNDNWSVLGHRDRIIVVGPEERLLFANIFDSSDNGDEARLPAIQSKQIIEVLKCFQNQKKRIENIEPYVFSTVLWDETNAITDRTMRRNVQFVDDPRKMIYSGPHIYPGNPYSKTPRRICTEKGHYDVIDLKNIPNDYLSRTIFVPDIPINDYIERIPKTQWEESYFSLYKVISRKMLNLPGERTLISAIIPSNTAHTNGLLGIAFKDYENLINFSAYLMSIPFDFFAKTLARPNFYYDTAKRLPFPTPIAADEIKARVLLLNCLTNYYSALWEKIWNPNLQNITWAKKDERLKNEIYVNMKSNWRDSKQARTDYERRQLLVELDVLTAMSLGMTLNELQTIYNVQFPVLKSNESDTWYDQNGKIVFTSSKSLVNVGFSRLEWNQYKDKKNGFVKQEIVDDTIPGGPIKRTIEYVAPFDRCDREQDYETVWKFFEEKYGKQVSGVRYQVSEAISKSETGDQKSEIKQDSAAQAVEQPDAENTSSRKLESDNRNQPDSRQTKGVARKEPEIRKNTDSRNPKLETSQKLVFGPPPKKPKQEPLVSKPAREEQAGQSTFLDYAMYRCPLCGKLVMSYDRSSHESLSHPGKKVEWRKIGEK